VALLLNQNQTQTTISLRALGKVGSGLAHKNTKKCAAGPGPYGTRTSGNRQLKLAIGN
jgi:hypothetical protein